MLVSGSSAQRSITMKKPYTFATHSNTYPDNSIGIAQPLNKYRSAWMIASVTIVRETEKAIQVASDDSKIKVWFPKSALQHDDRGGDFDATKNCNYIIASWFISSATGWNQWHDKFMQDCGSFIG
jgi:hypothetical protein